MTKVLEGENIKEYPTRLPYRTVGGLVEVDAVFLDMIHLSHASKDKTPTPDASR